MTAENSSAGAGAPTPEASGEPISHDLKCWPEYFGAVVSGAKRFEIRQNDRGFDVGHLVTLREWEPGTQSYTGRSATFRIGYMTSYGQKPGMVVYSLEPLASLPAAQGADVAAKLAQSAVEIEIAARMQPPQGSFFELLSCAAANMREACAALDARLSPPQAGEPRSPYKAEMIEWRAACRMARTALVGLLRVVDGEETGGAAEVARVVAAAREAVLPTPAALQRAREVQP